MDYRNPETLRALLRAANDIQIGRSLGVTDRTIRNWRHRLCIGPSEVPNRGNTKYILNRSFFRVIDTPEKAYILGFIATDGAIHRSGRSLSIAIAESDIALLYAIRDAMGGTNEVHTKVCHVGYQGEHRAAVLHLCGIDMVRDLSALGVGPNKTFTLRFPTLPDHLESHFIRGLFDGDGHVGKRQFYLVSASGLLAEVQASIHRHTGCLLDERPDHGYSRLIGYRHDRAALTWMYADAPIKLERKYEKWQTYWT